MMIEGWRHAPPLSNDGADFMNIALLGVSRWHAAMHADAARNAGAKISHIWDWDTGIAQRFSDAHEQAPVAELDAILAARPDLIVAMGHPNEVPALAARVIESGIPMILEKPAAPDTASIAALAEQARARSTFVAVPLANRFGPAMESPQGQPIAHAHFRLVNGPPQRYRDDGVGWVLDPAIGGGGALRNLGIHGIDCALSLAHGKLRIVSAVVTKRLHAEEAVEDHCHVVLTDEAGALFTVEAGYTVPDMAPGGDFEWRTVTASHYCIDHGSSVIGFSPGANGPRALTPLLPALRYRAFMADTLARLRENRAPLVSLDDYLAAMRLIDDIYTAAKS